MKDLFVQTADADAQAVMNEVIKRHHALGIRMISFQVERLTRHDPEMIRNGPELARLWKGKFQRILLLWDHHGSGREKNQSPEQVQAEIAERLDRVTWKDNHLAIVACPEIEEWLWHCPLAIQKHLTITPDEFNQWSQEFAKEKGKTLVEARKQWPKEMFEFILFRKERRKPRPRDFEKITALASLRDWQNSPSFSTIVQGLRQWFPEESPVGPP